MGTGPRGRFHSQAAVFDMAGNSAATSAVISHAPKGAGFAVPVTGVVVAILGLWLLLGLVASRPVDLTKLERVNVGATGEIVPIRAGQAGRYVVVARSDHGAYPSGEVATIVPGSGYRADASDFTGTYLHWGSDPPFVYVVSTVAVDHPVAIGVRPQERAIRDLYLVPIEDTPLVLNMGQLVFYLVMIVVGISVTTWGVLRRRSWSKQVRAYAAQIEATTQRSVG